MTIRNLDASLDWTWGKGRQNYLTDEAAIELNAATRLRSFLNDTFWAMDFGIDWWNLLGQRNPTAQANIVLQARQVIAESFGIVRINSVVAGTDPISRRSVITYNVDTIYTLGVIQAVQP